MILLWKLTKVSLNLSSKTTYANHAHHQHQYKTCTARSLKKKHPYVVLKITNGPYRSLTDEHCLTWSYLGNFGPAVPAFNTESSLFHRYHPLTIIHPAITQDLLDRKTPTCIFHETF